MTHETTAARASLADLGEGTVDASQCASVSSGAATPSPARVVGEGGLFRTCAICRLVFRKPAGVSWKVWGETRCCSRSCAMRRRRANQAPFVAAWRDTVKSCECCAKEFRPKEGDDKDKFQRRRFCSVACKNKAMLGKSYPQRPDNIPLIKKEWPASERFDAPGMNMPEGPGNFVRVNPNMARWI